MEISILKKKQFTIFAVNGRLDAFGAEELQKSFSADWPDESGCIVVDMKNTEYISSAGIRVLMSALKELKKNNGNLVISSANPYCREILEITGFDKEVLIFNKLIEVEEFFSKKNNFDYSIDAWKKAESKIWDSGTVKVLPLSDQSVNLEVLGDVSDILHASVTPDKVYSKHLSETEYSLGVGGLGATLEDSFNIMGEMMTLGNNIIWLPTDDHNSPDYLEAKNALPGKNIIMHTAFNLTLKETFNKLIFYEKTAFEGITLKNLYHNIFDLCKNSENDFKGAIGILICAEMENIEAEDIKKSPVSEFTPDDGKMINSPQNMPDWFNCRKIDKSENSIALILGIGVDLLSDLSAYNENVFNKVFSLSPYCAGGKDLLSHDCAVFFDNSTVDVSPGDLEAKIKEVIASGQFKQIAHLRKNSVINKALIGVYYLDEFVEGDFIQQENRQADASHPQGHYIPSKVMINSYRKHNK